MIGTMYIYSTKIVIWTKFPKIYASKWNFTVLWNAVHSSTFRINCDEILKMKVGMVRVQCTCISLIEMG